MVSNEIWIRCTQCRHKLFLISPPSQVKMSIKCHSCKTINNIEINTNNIKSDNYTPTNKN